MLFLCRWLCGSTNHQQQVSGFISICGALGNVDDARKRGTLLVHASCRFSSTCTHHPRTTTQPDEAPKPAPKPPRPPPLPTVDGKSGQLDVVSRLLKDRILLLGTDVNDEMANVLVAQLLYLANEDPDKDITLYINSPVRKYLKLRVKQVTNQPTNLLTTCLFASRRCCCTSSSFFLFLLSFYVVIIVVIFCCCRFFGLSYAFVFSFILS